MVVIKSMDFKGFDKNVAIDQEEVLRPKMVTVEIAGGGAKVVTLTLDAEPAAFHEWRKRVKDHWYQVRLFARLPNGPRSRTDTLRRLEQWLGKDHDLATLRSIVLDGDDRYGDAHARTMLLGSITKRQKSLNVATSHPSMG